MGNNSKSSGPVNISKGIPLLKPINAIQGTPLLLK
jgi:hypothetical protein